MVPSTEINDEDKVQNTFGERIAQNEVLIITDDSYKNGKSTAAFVVIFFVAFQQFASDSVLYYFVFILLFS